MEYSMRYASLVVFLFFPFFSFSQSISSINTDDLELKISVKHHVNYPNSGDAEWWKQEWKGAPPLYLARFKHDGNDFLVIYNNNIKVLQEWTIIDEVPSLVDLHLLGLYSKFKLKLFLKVIDAETKNETFVAVVKVNKSEDLVHTYNEAFDPIDNTIVHGFMELLY